MSDQSKKIKEDTKKSVSSLSGAKFDGLSFETDVKGVDLEKELSIDDLIASFKTTGLQASNLYNGILEIRKMRKANAKIFFGATSNITSSGLREVVKYMAKNKYFEVYVTSGGAIEEDIIKCLGKTKIASFELDGHNLRENGWNRIGNMVIHNDNYLLYEKWMNELLNELTEGYTPENPIILTPSKLIKEMGKKINNEESVLYWCYKNNIPVYSPSVLDGSTGDMFTFFHGIESIKIDLAEDIKAINFEAVNQRENGAIIIGAGLIKHHILNANLFNNGLDYCVIMNTAVEYDRSDSGAAVQEAYSWGKIKPFRSCLKIHGEASVLFPLLIYGGFKSNTNFE